MAATYLDIYFFSTRATPPGSIIVHSLYNTSGQTSGQHWERPCTQQTYVNQGESIIIVHISFFLHSNFSPKNNSILIFCFLLYYNFVDIYIYIIIYI